MRISPLSATRRRGRKIPDPNAASTFEASVARPPPEPDATQQGWLDLHRTCLALRRQHIVPRLAGCTAIGAQTLSEAAVRAAWRMNDGAVLTLAANFGAAPVACKPGSEVPLFSTSDRPMETSELPGFTTRAWLQP